MIAMNHYYSNGVRFSAYTYINEEIITPHHSCIKDVYAKIYHGNMYILEPRYQRFYLPRDIGFIGKIDTCNYADIEKWQSIKWNDKGAYFGEEHSHMLIKFN